MGHPPPQKFIDVRLRLHIYPEYDRVPDPLSISLCIYYCLCHLCQNEQKEKVVLKLVKTVDLGVVMVLTFKCNEITSHC